jgi:hypothetical protein
MEDSLKKKLFVKTVREWQAIEANSTECIEELSLAEVKT